MFDILFGWRKASKCKKLIRRVQCRLKLLKNKRCSIARQLRQDLAQLLKNGHEQTAFDRINQLFVDESMVTVYELLDHFCEFIVIHLSYIRRSKECPNDVNEAVSTLIFASARLGDLPELRVIRKLFGERYGHKLATVALELLPGNLVNHQITEKLSMNSVSDDMKYMLLDEIARTCLPSGPLALEYCSELHRQQANNTSVNEVPMKDVRTGYIGNEGFQIHSSENRESTEGLKYCKNTLPLSVTMNEAKVEKSIQMNSPYEVTISGQSTTGSSSSSIVPNAVALVIREGNTAIESSSESSSQLPEEMIYLDDIEEFESPMSTKDVKCQDQRLFMFKSPVLHKREKIDYGLKEGYIEQSKRRSEIVNSRSSTKSGRAGEKRIRRRSVSQERSCVKDVECALYYGESRENSPNKNHKSHHRERHPKNNPMDESQKLYSAQERMEKRGNNFKSGKCRDDQMKSRDTHSFRSEIVHSCSLEHPCYTCVSDYKEDWERPPSKQKRRTTTLKESRTCYVKEDKTQHDNRIDCYSREEKQHDQELGLDFSPQKPRRNIQNCAAMSNKLSYRDHRPNKQGKEVEGEAEKLGFLGRHAASICSSSKWTSTWTRKETVSPYLRAMTMPLERPKESCSDHIVRAKSLPFEQPSPHVHPKLPDYDELAAKFRALKEANMRR